MKRVTLKAVNKAIQEVYPYVELVKGNGYWYISGTYENSEWDLKIAGLYQTSIYVKHLSAYTIERWVDEVKQLIEKEEYHITAGNADNQ